MENYRFSNDLKLEFIQLKINWVHRLHKDREMRYQCLKSSRINIHFRIREVKLMMNITFEYLSRNSSEVSFEFVVLRSKDSSVALTLQSE